MKITTIGLDLAKNVFQIHGVDERGQTCFASSSSVTRSRRSSRAWSPARSASRPAVAHTIGRPSSGGSAHHVKMMAPQFVKPYVKTNKNNSLDAEAICEAVAQPNMRFVPVKSPERSATSPGSKSNRHME